MPAKPMSLAAIRRTLRAEYGDRNYRIVGGDQVWVYSPPRNSTVDYDWRFFGCLSDRGDLAKIARIAEALASGPETLEEIEARTREVLRPMPDEWLGVPRRGI